MDFHHLGGGSGSGGGGGTGEHPWEVGFLFGGDDDEGGPAAPRRRRRQQRARQQDEADDPFEEEFEELSKSDLSSIEVAIGPTRPRRQQNRWGDAHYRAVEDSLMDPTRLGRQSLTPESLIGHSGPQDPLGRPAAIERFLSTALPDSSVATFCFTYCIRHQPTIFPTLYNTRDDSGRPSLFINIVGLNQLFK